MTSLDRCNSLTRSFSTLASLASILTRSKHGYWPHKTINFPCKLQMGTHEGKDQHSRVVHKYVLSAVLDCPYTTMAVKTGCICTQTKNCPRPQVFQTCYASDKTVEVLASLVRHTMYLCQGDTVMWNVDQSTQQPSTDHSICYGDRTNTQ